MLNAALFLVSIGITGLFTREALRWLRLESWADLSLAAAIIGLAHLVLTGEIAGLIHVLNAPLSYLGVQFVLLLVLYVVRRALRIVPRLAIPSFRGPLAVFKSDPLLAAFAVLVASGYLFNAILILTVPQNNMDSLSTHLARVGHWLQHGTFFPWETPRIWQVIYPYNAPFLVLWPILFLRSDVLAGFPQWFAALVSALAIGGMAVELGASRRAASYAALTFLTFPIIALQASTAQTDLLVMASFVLAVHFLLRGLRLRKGSLLMLSAIAIGLGTGIKQTFLFLLFPLALVLLAAWLYHRAPWRLLGAWIISCAIAILALGTMSYAVNWATFGNPLGPPEIVSQSAGELQVSVVAPKLGTNAFRLFYQSLDTSGLPRPLDGYVHKAKARLFQWLLQATSWQVEGERYAFPSHPFSLEEKNAAEESHAWYGPLSALLLYPAMLYALWDGLRRRHWVRVALPLAFALFAAIEILARPGWDPYQGRYFAGVFALNAPLVAALFEASPPRGARLALRALTVVLSGVILFTTLAYNPSKPVLGKWADDIGVWRKDRIFLQTVQRKKERPVHYMVNDHVPMEATLGIYVPGYLMEYPLFGPRFTRRIVVVHPRERLSDTAWWQKQGIEYLLFQSSHSSPDLPPSFCDEIAHWQQWLLMHCIETEP